MREASQTCNMVSSLPLLRLANSLLGSLTPAAMARVAVRLFTSPDRHPIPERELAALRRGRRVALGEGISALRFGAADRRGRGMRVLAMHGWEGRASQWGPLAELASEADFELIAVDAPGHGHSAGHRSHPGEFARALLEADRRHGPFAAVIGHSMGGAAAALALASGLRAERAVLIASPASFERVLHRFATHMRLPPPAERALFEQMELIVGRPAEDLDIAALSLRCPALVIHSRDDREVPFTEGEVIVQEWPRAELLALDELGHRRILRDPTALVSALQFIGEPARLARAG